MDNTEMKRSRRTIHSLQIAATDKENLTKKIIPKKKPNMNNGRLTEIKKPQKNNAVENSNKNVVSIKNNINKIKSEVKNDNSNKTIAEDLTSDTPSENYWQKLAESRRVALDSALKENVDLHNKLTELEYENSRLRTMLDEAKSLVEVLTEMIEDKGESNDTAEEADQSTASEAKDNSDYSDSEADVSFQSCLQ